MEITIVINAKNTSQEDIRSFLQTVKEWELRTPKTDITGIRFETDPEITSEDAKAIFEGVFPEFEKLVEIPNPQRSLLRLGARGITVDGKLIGTCSELALSIGQASEEDVKKLEKADAIVLVRIRRG